MKNTNSFSLSTRLITLIIALLIITLIFIEFVLLPLYKEMIFSQRITVVTQLQEKLTTQFDIELDDMILTGSYLVSKLERKPQEFIQTVNDVINLKPKFAFFSLYAIGSSDDLEVTNPLYPSMTFNHSSYQWIEHQENGRVFEFTFIENEQSEFIFLAIRLSFVIRNENYRGVIIFDIKEFMSSLTHLPLDGSYFSTITNTKTSIAGNKLPEGYEFSILTQQKLNTFRKLDHLSDTWYELITPFNSLPIFSVVGINSSIIQEPIKRIQLITYIFFAGFILTMGFIVNYLTKKTLKPLDELRTQIEPMKNLSFSKPVPIISFPEFRPLSEAVETMRQKLYTYQQLNVDKIIQEESKNRVLVNYMNDPMVIADSFGQINLINQSFQSLITEELDAKIPESIDQLLLLLKGNRLAFVTRRLQEKDFNVELSQWELQLTTGTKLQYFRQQTGHIYKQNNELIGTIISLHDLTHDREMDIVKNDMMNIIIHELRNPLMSIMGFTDMLIDEPDLQNETHQKYLDVIKTSGNRLNSLVNRFLELRRLESRKVELNPRMIDLASIVKVIVETFRPQLATKELAIETRIQPNTPKIYADYDLMNDVVQNLISNAIKYGDHLRTIYIDITYSPHSVIFSITDYGYGISESDQKKLFAKFFRVKSNEKAYKEVGTGLGLAYVKEIVQQHHGIITLDSNPSFGCKFTITWKIKPDFSEAISS